MFSKEAPAETFVAVKISSGHFLATTWHIASGKVEVGPIASGEITADDSQAMLAAADKAVSSVLQESKEKTHKVIFGLTPDWIFEGKIIPEKLNLLRHLCKDLDLSPLGFVPGAEAIENFLKEAEGAPLTAILVGLDKDRGWVTIYRAGKNLGTVPIPENPDICAGIEKSLKTFTGIDVLPARMIIYDGIKDLADLEAKITAHPWTKNLPFLHLPKVEVLPGETVVKAVAIAGGTQMGGKIDEEEAPKPEVEEVSAAEAGFVSGENLGQLQEFEVKQPTMPKISLPNIKLKRPKIPIGFPLIGLAVAVIISLLAAFIYFVPKETIIVRLASKEFAHQMAVTAPGQVVTVTEIGSKKGIASGKKLVGDKATGSVTIANLSDAKTFPAGTALTSSGGLKFVLTSSVQIASGSGYFAATTTTAPVQAADIGDQYNLPANTLFSIGGLSAKNDAAFTGGNSHQATVITQADQDRLVASLSAELNQKAQNDLTAKLTDGQKLLPNAITQSINKEKFSGAVGDEAETVSLDLTVDFKGVVATQADIVNNFLTQFPNEIPSGYELVPDQTNMDIQKTSVDKSGNVVMTVYLDARFLPKVDKQQLIKDIAGKSQTAAEGVINKLPGVKGISFEAKPSFLSGITRLALPFRQNAFSIEVVSE